MTKQEKKMVWKAYSLLMILKEETDKYYLKEEIERIARKLQKSLEN